MLARYQEEFVTHDPEYATPVQQIDDAAREQTWFLEGDVDHREADKALASIKFKSGGFVIRKSNTFENDYILCYADGGRSHNEVIHLGTKGIRLRRSKVPFPNLSELVSFYSNPSYRSFAALPVVLDPTAFKTAPSRFPSSVPSKTPIKNIKPKLSQERVMLTFDIVVEETFTISDVEAVVKDDAFAKSFPLSNVLSMGRPQSEDGALYTQHNIRDWVIDQNDVPLENWTSADILELLFSMNLGFLAPTFERLKIDGPAFAKLTAEELKQLQVPEDAATRLLLKQASLARAALYTSALDITQRPMTYGAPNDPVEHWDAFAVRNWLLCEGYPQAAEIFLSHGVVGLQLLQLTADDILDMGVSEEDTLRLLHCVDVLDENDGLLNEDSDRPPIQMELWNPGHIYTFMVEHGFQKDAKVFLAHNINGRALLVMGEDDLMELGMPEERASIFRSLVTDAFELSTQELAAQEDANQRLLEPFVPASNASRWTTTEVLQWLRAIDLPHLQPTFASAKINGHVLINLQESGLRNIGVEDETDLMTLQKAIRSLRRRSNMNQKASNRSSLSVINDPIEFETTLTQFQGSYGFHFGGGDSGDNQGFPIVTMVVPGLPADRHLQPGDILVSANGHDLASKTQSDVRTLITRLGPSLTLRVIRWPTKLVSPKSSSRSAKKADQVDSETSMDVGQGLDLSQIRGRPPLVVEGTTPFPSKRVARQMSLPTPIVPGPLLADKGEASHHIVGGLQRSATFEEVVRQSDEKLATQQQLSRVGSGHKARGSFRKSQSGQSDSTADGEKLSEVHTDNPLTWNPDAVANFFQSAGLLEAAKAFKKRRLSGEHLLIMTGVDLESLDLPTHEKEVAEIKIGQLQEKYRAPLASFWTTQDVSEFLDQKGFAAARKIMLKKRVNGRVLCTITQADLDKLEIPHALRHGLLSESNRLLSTYEPMIVKAPEWTTPEVYDWLRSIRLNHLVPTFRREHISGQNLLQLNYDALYALGIRTQSDLLLLAESIEKIKRISVLRSSPLVPKRSVPRTKSIHSNRSASIRNNVDNVESWDSSKVCDWLYFQDLGDLCEKFVEQNITGEKLVSLSEADLDLLGVETHQSRHLISALDVLMAQQTPESDSVGAHTLKIALWNVSASQMGIWLNSHHLQDVQSILPVSIDGFELIKQSGEEFVGMNIPDSAREKLLGAVTSNVELISYPLLVSISTWSTKHVGSLLKRHGLPSLVNTFENAGIDGSTFLKLSALDLHRIGVTNSAFQTVILDAIDQLTLNCKQSGKASGGISEWTADDVADWFKEIPDFSHLAEDVVLFGINGAALLEMTSEHFNLLFSSMSTSVSNLLLERRGQLKNRKRSHSLRSINTGSQLLRVNSFSSDVAAVHASSWSMGETADWLETIGLSDLKSTFFTHSVSGATLLRLTPDDLDTMNVLAPSIRAKLLSAISDLKRVGTKSPVISSPLMKSRNTSLNTHPLLAEDARSPWMHAHLLPSRARIMLSGQSSGTFVVHQAENIDDYELSYVNEQLTITKQSFHGFPATGVVRFRNSNQQFSSFKKLVNYYSQPQTQDEYVTVLLNPDVSGRLTLSSDSPLKSSQKVLSPWDKTNVPDFDAIHSLDDRPAGCFFVTKNSENGWLELHVRSNDGIFSYRIYESDAGFQLMTERFQSQPFPSLDALIQFYREQHSEFPVPLIDFDVQQDISARIRAHASEVEQPWSWWQLDKTSAEAELVLSNKQTGAFVVYRKSSTQSFPLVLAYRDGKRISRVEIHHSPASSLFNQGLFLQGSQNEVFSSLHELVDHYRHFGTELGCPLRSSIEPPQGLPLELPKKDRPRSFRSWCQIGTDPRPALDALQNRSVGSFFVYADEIGASDFKLAYRAAEGVIHEDIITLRNAEGTMFALQSAPERSYPTLWDLVSFHEENSYSLKTKLNIATHSQLIRTTPHSEILHGESDSEKWVWCQIGVPLKQASQELSSNVPGSFVVRSVSEHDRDFADDDTVLILSYVAADKSRQDEPIKQSRQTSTATLIFESKPEIQGTHLEELLFSAIQSPILQCKLKYPPNVRGRYRTRSPAPIRKAEHMEWNCWQLDSHPEDALSVLEPLPTGGFVIRNDPQRPGHFILSYKYQNLIHDEPISHSPHSSMFNQGYSLDSNVGVVHPDLTSLVKYHAHNMDSLKCSLRLPPGPLPILDTSSIHTANPGTSPAHHGRTMGQLQALTNDPKAMAKFSPTMLRKQQKVSN